MGYFLNIQGQQQIFLGMFFVLVFIIIGAVRGGSYFTKSEKNIITFSFITGPIFFVVLLIVYIQKEARLQAAKKFNKGYGKVSNNLESLIELKKANLITENEFQVKLSELEKEQSNLNLENKLKTNKTYKSLLQLKNSGLLNEIEFKEKVKTLREQIMMQINSDKEITISSKTKQSEIHSISQSQEEKKGLRKDIEQFLFLMVIIVIALLALMVSYNF